MSSQDDVELIIRVKHPLLGEMEAIRKLKDLPARAEQKLAVER